MSNQNHEISTQPQKSSGQSIINKSVGVVELTTGDASQKKILFNVDNVAFITEAQLGQQGRTVVALKNPPISLQVAQGIDVVVRAYMQASDNGGKASYKDFVEQN